MQNHIQLIWECRSISKSQLIAINIQKLKGEKLTVIFHFICLSEWMLLFQSIFYAPVASKKNSMSNMKNAQCLVHFIRLIIIICECRWGESITIIHKIHTIYLETLMYTKCSVCIVYFYLFLHQFEKETFNLNSLLLTKHLKNRTLKSEWFCVCVCFVGNVFQKRT